MRALFRRARRSVAIRISGVHLKAKDGNSQLDEMTTNTARGPLLAVMRRQPNGT